MHDIWQRFISEKHLGNRWADFFHIAHTYPPGDVDVPLSAFEL